MNVSNHQKYEKIVSEIYTLRDIGTVTVKIADLPNETVSVFAKLDNFVTSLGFEPIDSRWVEINFEQARALTTRVLHQDLAYNGEIIPLTKAKQLTEVFFDFFDTGKTRFFTNGGFYKFETSFGWTPLRRASTFDTGVICFDRNLIGFLWVEDED